MIGRFVNLIALRTRIPAGDSLCAALDRIRGATLDAFAHQELPFERLVAAATERGLALPRVLFNLVGAPLGAIELPDAGAARALLGRIERALGYFATLSDRTVDEIVRCLREPEAPIEAPP